MTSILANSKSTNPLISDASVDLFRACLSNRWIPSILTMAVTELLSLPKSGRSSGPYHRVVLYSMLASVPAASSVSASIVRDAVPLLAKETHEPAMAVLASLLPVHISFLLDSSTVLPADITSQIAKEINSSTTATRRAFYSMIGTTLWNLADPRSVEALTLAGSLLPCFQASLKVAAATPLNLIAGPLESYVALVSLLRQCHQSDQSGIRMPSRTSTCNSYHSSFRRRSHFSIHCSSIIALDRHETVVPRVGQSIPKDQFCRRRDLVTQSFRGSPAVLEE
jgi:hypothetical protein